MNRKGSGKRVRYSEAGGKDGRDESGARGGNGSMFADILRGETKNKNRKR